MRYNKKKALADNVNAIETALAVHSQGRQATDSEKKTLALYSGFGGIKEVLNIVYQNPEIKVRELLGGDSFTYAQNAVLEEAAGQDFAEFEL